jgi:hypothetical protein
LAGALLFWRPACSQLAIGVFPRSVVCFGSDGKAFVIGERSNQLSRFLAYNGAHEEGYSCRTRNIGDLQFDEVIGHLSTGNFAILFHHSTGHVGVAVPTTQKEDSSRLFRIAVLQSEVRANRVAEQIATLQKEYAADLIITIQNDREKNWHQWTTDQSLQRVEGMAPETGFRQAFPSITFTVCPYRTLSVLPFQKGRDGLRQ